MAARMGSLRDMGEAGGESAWASTSTSLESLRSEGAQRLDPVRFHYLEALSRRLNEAPTDVRGILVVKLDAALSDYEQRWRQVPQAVPVPTQPLVKSPGKPAAHRSVAIAAPLATPTAASPLAQLNQHLRQLAQQPADSQGAGSHRSASHSIGQEPTNRPEMKSLRGFRETWAKISAQNQLDKAVGRAPQNAGPLNSHLLVLRSLGLMRDLSPDYLRRFLSHLDALLWLEQANQAPAAAAAKLARRAKKDKPPQPPR